MFYENMKIMWKLILIIFFFGFKLNSFSQNETIKTTLIKKLPVFLNNIPNGNEKEFGFKDRTQFDLISIGDPIQLATLKSNLSKDSFINYTNQWRVPIIVNNQYVLLATVSNKNELYELEDIGGSLLALEIQKLNLLGKLILVRDYVNYTDYIFDVQNKTIFPLSSARQKFNDLKDKFKLDEFYSFIKLIEKNTQSK